VVRGFYFEQRKFLDILGGTWTLMELCASSYEAIQNDDPCIIKT
jgi:hypothetical protein